MTPLVLKEWGEARLQLGHDDLMDLRSVAGEALSFAPTADHELWAVRAASWVGTISTRSSQILIQPKVGAANLFAMLEADGDPLDLRDAVFEYEQTANLASAFATFYCAVLERAIALGLQREYVEVETPLLTTRGRIDMPRQLRAGGLPIPLACVYDDYLVDSQLNRIVAAAASRLLLLGGVASGTRRGLRRCLQALDGVGPLRRADLSSPTKFTRLTNRFRRIEQLARMALQSSSITDAGGRAAASCFLVDMNVVFENFVENGLRRALAGRLDVRGQYRTKLDVGGSVPIKPDLVFRKGDAIVYVADAKYKIAPDGVGRQADYYQLLAYCTALGVHEGVLLYAQSEGLVPEKEVTVLGASAKVLRTMSVNITGAPRDLELEMKRVALQVFDWAKESTREAAFV
jgi:5-methylcytosine-specific restriction enzyme subunit McrC